MGCRLWWEADILRPSKVSALIEALICACDICNLSYTTDRMILCGMLILAGIKSSWSQCALSLPLNTDLGWSLWLQGFSLSLWLRLEHGSSSVSPDLTRTASFSTVSDSSTVSEWAVISDGTRDHGEYKKCLSIAVYNCILRNTSVIM
jgi:hypothetical protein